MEFTTDNGTYQLPKLTFGLSEKMDKAGAAGSDRNGFKARYDFIKEIIGDDAAEVELDGSKFEEVDMVKLSVVFQSICAAYSKPVIDAQRKHFESQTEGWSEALDPVEKALNAAQTAKAMSNRQNFRVK